MLAGQEDYDNLRTITYPNTDIFLVCFSVDNHDSLLNVAEKWVKDLEKHSPNTPFILVIFFLFFFSN